MKKQLESLTQEFETTKNDLDQKIKEQQKEIDNLRAQMNDMNPAIKERRKAKEKRKYEQEEQKVCGKLV